MPAPEAELARMLLSGLSPAEIEASLMPGSALAESFSRRRGELDRVAAMLAAGVSHAGQATPGSVARMFDAAVRAAPEASVAAYTLGDPALLGQATDEIVAWLDQHRLVVPGAVVLDLGCGIGRLAAALAPRAGSVLGLDVSPGMVAEARLRHGHLPGLRFAVTDGVTLEGPSASLDLVLAVDSFPYLVQAGVADAHAAAAACLLRPGGVLAVLNLSYEDATRDRVRARGWADRLGFSLEACGERPFTTWDGAAFLLRRVETIRRQGHAQSL